MTIQEAINRVDALRPNAQKREWKIRWLSELDGLIYHEIILTHERAHAGPKLSRWDIITRYPPEEREALMDQLHAQEDTEKFTGYNNDTPQDTVLLAPYPYDEIYQHYLNRQIDLQNLEMDKYNNDTALFNNAYETFSNWYTRTHMPIQRQREMRI